MRRVKPRRPRRAAAAPASQNIHVIRRPTPLRLAVPAAAEENVNRSVASLGHLGVLVVHDAVILGHPLFRRPGGPVVTTLAMIYARIAGPMIGPDDMEVPLVVGRYVRSAWSILRAGQLLLGFPGRSPIRAAAEIHFPIEYIRAPQDINAVRIGSNCRVEIVPGRVVGEVQGEAPGFPVVKAAAVIDFRIDKIRVFEPDRMNRPRCRLPGAATRTGREYT